MGHLGREPKQKDRQVSICDLWMHLSVGSQSWYQMASLTTLHPIY